MIHHAPEVGSLPSGMVVANNVDVQRCNLLIHQTKRIFRHRHRWKKIYLAG
ncbi:putative tRNA (cytosine(34)-C(5))-methyltransferase [Helianthus annuus]|uniref:tRNA (Cytosine(34)-C(5))-methyltransferase n=1 Tax=Helianthus annuus TaxID=4232 RepID=A0A251UXM1_HELAN|nr:putative tRNA (cytosine(34)-C(5))-methyltransferase [Helianthus annuus]KAJ0581079.1 putative tRNA (cytosine(34)-C(5))-methyltransferase [Helianthus annuus]KAJ0597025.1 putative tRNA (cytosine(34)-C(5))-methyltransferase [Helianthus annuus]KAJ0757707.1 putative tRNA (cytosine(34)-C(5))-methyltransferase [Helianthus annuus]KAJ0761389.1 putative tRNA (cytosine(34)-C(5))-methyltransferase [Helianthus annuus]